MFACAFTYPCTQDNCTWLWYMHHMPRFGYQTYGSNQYPSFTKRDTVTKLSTGICNRRMQEGRQKLSMRTLHGHHTFPCAFDHSPHGVPNCSAAASEATVANPTLHERLAEYGWKPHRVFLAQKTTLRGSIYWYMRERQRCTVSSNSRSQTALFPQYSANLIYCRSQGCPFQYITCIIIINIITGRHVVLV